MMRHAARAPAESSAAVVKVFLLPSLFTPLQALGALMVSQPLRLNVAAFMLFNKGCGREGVENSAGL